MSLDRRVAVDDSTDVLPGTGVQTGGGPAARARRDQQERLSRVPTQRGPLVGTAPARPEPLEPVAVPQRRTGRAALMVGAVTATIALAVATGVVQHQSSVRLAERHAEEVRLAAAVATIGSDELASDRALRDDLVASVGELASARAQLSGAVTAATQALEASPHAGETALAALRAAIAQVTDDGVAPLATLADLAAATDALAAPVAAVQSSEATWQAAEAARVEAERKAAEEAARKAAEEAAAKAAAARTSKPRSTSTSTQTAQSPAPATGTSTPTIPSGGLVCPGAPTGAGAGESSVDAIGAGINAYRQSQGLPALGVSRSGTLVSHAIDMATAGGIWHSGSDNIVGCTSGSVQSLITAWSRSAPHNAQMLRTDVSSMSVGGASLGGWLYGAVKFN